MVIKDDDILADNLYLDVLKSVLSPWEQVFCLKVQYRNVFSYIKTIFNHSLFVFALRNFTLFFLQVMVQMQQVMKKYNCVGIAAPQIGVPLR